jgi:hypothetical protein
MSRIVEGVKLKRFETLSVAREHQDALLYALSKAERDTLTALLLRVADQQGLTRGVHPGFARIRAGTQRSLKSDTAFTGAS